jgi:MFS family permease
MSRIIAHTVPLHKRPVVNSLAAAVESISSTVAPVLGGALTDRLSWRWCFFINVPVGAFCAILIVIFFQNPLRSETSDTCLTLGKKLGKLYLWGTAFFVSSTALLLLALQWGGTQYGWVDWHIILCFIGSAVLLVLFTIQQRHMGEENATFPRRVLKNRSVLAGCWFSLCNTSASSVVGYYMPIYFQVVRNYTVLQSRILYLPVIVGLSIAVLLAPPLIHGMGGYYTPAMIITSCLTPIAAGLLTTLTVASPLIRILVYEGLLGFFTGIGAQSPQIAVQTVFDSAPGDASLAIAAVLFAQNFGPSVFVPVAQALFTDLLDRYLPTKDIAAIDADTGSGGGGLLDLRKLIPASELDAVLAEFDDVISHTFYLAVGLACATLLGTLGMEWRSVKQKRS